MTVYKIFKLKKYDMYYPCNSKPGTSRSLVGDAATGQEWPTGFTGLHGKGKWKVGWLARLLG